jgi:pilus assembly protein CpaD
VIRRFIRKDATMASKSALLLVAAALSGCAYHPGPDFEAGMAPVNVPVVSRTDYTSEAAAPNGTLAPADAARLNDWFRGLDLRYGDTIYVDGSQEAARSQIAEIAGNYGIFVSPGSPVVGGAVAPGNIRVIVSRHVASVPNCPNWERKAQPNYNNKSLPNLGCAVNSNFAAMVANPVDLVHGREGSSVVDAVTAAKAIQMYRDWPLTGITPGVSLRPVGTIDTNPGGK